VEQTAADQLRRLLQATYARRQGGKRADFIREFLTSPEAGQVYGQLRQQGVERGEVLKTLTELGPRLAQKKYPIETSRLWETFFPTGTRANFLILAPGRELGTLRLASDQAEKALAKNLPEAQRKLAALAEELKIAPESLMITPPQVAKEGAVAELSQPSFWVTVSKLAKGLDVSKDEVLKQLGSVGKLPIGIKQPYKGGLFGRHFQFRKGLLRPPTDPKALQMDLESYLSEAARVTELGPALRSAGKLYPAIARIAGGEKTGLARWYEKYLQNVGGVPKWYEKRISEAALRMAEQNHWASSLVGPLAGDPAALRRFSSQVRTFQTMAKLGLRLTSVVAQLSQTVINTGSVVKPQTLVRAIYEAVHRPRRWDWLFRDATVAQLTGQAGMVEAEIRPGLRGLFDTSMWMFKKGEELNQRVASIAGFIEKTGITDPLIASKSALRGEGTEAAFKLLLRTQFHYGPANLPSALQGSMESILFQFRPFLINQVGFMMGLAPKEAAKFFTTLGVLTGAGAIPLIEPAHRFLFPFSPLTPAVRGIEELQIRYPGGLCGPSRGFRGYAGVQHRNLGELPS
jgi:hypothetical protein